MIGHGMRFPTSPPARVSIFLEDSFALKRFQRDGGIAGLGSSLRSCYGDWNVPFKVDWIG